MKWVHVSVRKQNRGAALVEMALILPLLLLLVFGIIEFGWMLRSYQAVGSVAREACRTGALGGDLTAITNKVTTVATNTYDLQGTKDTTVYWRQRANDATDPAWTEWSTTPIPSSPTTGNYLEVRVQVVYHYSPLTGALFGWLYNANADHTWRLRSSVVMRKEPQA